MCLSISIPGNEDEMKYSALRQGFTKGKNPRLEKMEMSLKRERERESKNRAK
jgi:hypothetical protein